MRKDDLFDRVRALGYSLFDTEDSGDVNSTLADMVKSRESRLWEGFPLVLANSAENGLFSYAKVNRYLKKTFQKSSLASLVVMSLALYKLFNLKFSWSKELSKTLSSNRQKEFDGYLRNLKKGGNFNVAGREMSTHRLKSVFNNYFNQSQAKLNELLLVKDELSLEYSLSQVFSPKQKELFLKKLKREKLTKTEKEYFSRTIKKKVLALANPEMHRLSQKLLE